MKKQKIIIISGVILLGLIASVYQYAVTFKTESASAVTVGTSNPGHSLSQLECSAGSLCIDTVNNRVGIGTNNPAYKLDVNGTLNLNSNTISSVAAPIASTDAANKAYVDASSSTPACPTNYANLCSNGGGLSFAYSGKTLYIDAYPRASAWYASGSPTGQALAWQICGAIGARIPTLEEWQAACTALSGPNGNGTSTFGGGRSDRYEWTATPSSSAFRVATIAGGGTCAGTSTALVSNNGVDGYGTDGGYTATGWFRCVR